MGYAMDCSLRPCLLILAFFLLYSNVNCMEDGTTYIIRPGRVDCFHREIKKGTNLDFEMEVMKGGDLMLAYRIKSPSGEVIAEELKTTSVEKNLDATEDGVYDFCFDNSDSMIAEKVVYFDLGVYEENQDMYEELNGKLVADNTTDSKTFAEIVRVTELLRKRIDTVSNYQGIYRAKTGRHQYLIESNIARVTWFSFASCTIMIIVGILHVILVRNLFAEKRR